jgi:hypothetical protein
MWKTPGQMLLKQRVVFIVAACSFVLSACSVFNSFSVKAPQIPELTPSALSFPLSLTWHQRLERSFALPPRAWGATLIVPASNLHRDFQLYALDVRSGDVLWQRESDGNVAGISDEGA